jgi:uncharacterized protein YbbK (DUF523 family)
MKPRVGISRCLLGDDVRYDGTHKRADDLLASLGRHVEWVPVCPEVEVGMGTPREPIQLVSAAGRVRLLGVTSGEDWTERMQAWARERIELLRRLNLSGFVLKARSPSCGVRGGGMFAQALIDAMPDLPVAEEDDLADALSREVFLAKVRAFRP